MYKFREFTMLDFSPKVNDGREVELNLLTLGGESDDDNDDDPAAPDLRLAADDVVQDSVDIAATSSVTIRVYDSSPYTMEVWSTGEASQWDRMPIGSPTWSQYSAAIPATERNTTEMAMLIVVRDSGGDVVARRSQIVIIRHRPTS